MAKAERICLKVSVSLYALPQHVYYFVPNDGFGKKEKRRSEIFAAPLKF